MLAHLAVPHEFIGRQALNRTRFHILYHMSMVWNEVVAFFLNGRCLKGPFTFQFYTKCCDGIPAVIISASVNKVARNTELSIFTSVSCSGQHFKWCYVFVFSIFSLSNVVFLLYFIPNFFFRTFLIQFHHSFA